MPHYAFSAIGHASLQLLGTPPLPLPRAYVAACYSQTRSEEQQVTPESACSGAWHVRYRSMDRYFVEVAQL